MSDSRKTVSNTARNAQTQAGAMGIFGAAIVVGRGMSGEIERMEAVGQQQFCESDVIPTNLAHGLTEQRLRDLGFELGDQVGDDDLFRYARLPKGWERRATDHDMWSEIVDEQGRKRMSVFYKAAFYDRKASLRESPRFLVETECGHSNESFDTMTQATVKVFDAKTVLFEKTCVRREGEEWYDLDSRAQELGRDWLHANRPGWTDKAAAWAMD